MISYQHLLKIQDDTSIGPISTRFPANEHSRYPKTSPVGAAFPLGTFLVDYEPRCDWVWQLDWLNTDQNHPEPMARSKSGVSVNVARLISTSSTRVACVQKSMNLRRKTPGWKFDVKIRSCRVQMMQGFKTVAPCWTSPNRADYWAPPNARKIMGLYAIYKFKQNKQNKNPGDSGFPILGNKANDWHWFAMIPLTVAIKWVSVAETHYTDPPSPSRLPPTRGGNGLTRRNYCGSTKKIGYLPKSIKIHQNPIVHHILSYFPHWNLGKLHETTAFSDLAWLGPVICHPPGPPEVQFGSPARWTILHKQPRTQKH